MQIYSAISLSAVIFVTSLVMRYYREHDWLYSDISKSHFSNPTNYSLRDVPTTYYCNTNELNTILPHWDDREIHLYRLAPNCPFEFNLKELETTVRARRTADTCANFTCVCQHSSCVAPKSEVHTVDLQTVLSDPGWYVMFDAFLSEVAYDTLQRALPLSWISRATTVVEHAFLSNFKQSIVTAVIHSNPFSNSLAIQYVGSKTWLFFPRETFIADDGMAAAPVTTFTAPRRAPNFHFEIYPYTSRPGDLLFFQESWGHTVFTHEGPNLLVNYRKISIHNLLRQPAVFLQAAFDRLLYVGEKHHENKVTPSQRVLNIMTKQNTLCADATTTKFDQDMMALLLATANVAQEK